MKQIKDFPKYYINKFGRIFSLYTNRFLKGRINIYGYVEICLVKNKQRYYKKVHRLVLETFVGPCPLKMECRHLDGNKQNNNLSNLCWGTASENQQDRVGHGTSNQGEKNPAVKLTEEEIKEIRKIYKIKYVFQRKLAKRFGVSQSQISRIINDTSWKYLRK